MENAPSGALRLVANFGGFGRISDDTRNQGGASLASAAAIIRCDLSNRTQSGKYVSNFKPFLLSCDIFDFHLF